MDLAATLGIAMEIATEKRESELAYLVGSLGQDGYAVFDNGSRSIELVARGGTRAPPVVLNLGTASRTNVLRRGPRAGPAAARVSATG